MKFYSSIISKFIQHDGSMNVKVNFLLIDKKITLRLQLALWSEKGKEETVLVVLRYWIKKKKFFSMQICYDYFWRLLVMNVVNNNVWRDGFHDYYLMSFLNVTKVKNFHPESYNVSNFNLIIFLEKKIYLTISRNFLMNVKWFPKEV